MENQYAYKYLQNIPVSESEEELIEILDTMSENNQMLPYLYNEHKNLLTYYMQNIKQTIINVKN